MANVHAIEQFAIEVEDAIRQLIDIRDILNATDVLWPSLNAGSKTNIHTQVDNQLTQAKAAVSALTTP